MKRSPIAQEAHSGGTQQPQSQDISSSAAMPAVLSFHLDESDDTVAYRCSSCVLTTVDGPYAGSTSSGDDRVMHKTGEHQQGILCTLREKSLQHRGYVVPSWSLGHRITPYVSGVFSPLHFSHHVGVWPVPFKASNSVHQTYKHLRGKFIRSREVRLSASHRYASHDSWWVRSNQQCQHVPGTICPGAQRSTAGI